MQAELLATPSVKTTSSPAPFRRWFLPLALVLGVLTGYAQIPILMDTAQIVSQIFVRFLKLVSMPICFLSITATLSGMKDFSTLKSMGSRVLRYTLFTTLLAALVALGFFLWVDPSVDAQQILSKIPNSLVAAQPAVITEFVTQNNGLASYFLNAIPTNVLQPFLEGNVIGIMILAILTSLAVISLPEQPKSTMHQLLKGSFAVVMQITQWLILVLPLAIWAFISLFMENLHQMGPQALYVVKSLALYLMCVVGANLFQALIVLPIFLKRYGLSPIKIAKGMLPALFFAFWSKSSSATLPLALECAEQRLNVRPTIARFSLPLCTTINMNACAGFILLTVLFVSSSHGLHFSGSEYLGWVLVATIAAVGNAGIPMGCYFLSAALLTSLNLPLTLMAIILPFYALLDMLETAINVWSDACVTCVVNETTIDEAASLV